MKTFFGNDFAAQDVKEFDVNLYYDIVRPNPKDEIPYFNLGFWRDHPPTLQDACEALARELAESAGFREGDEVLDVGFGLAAQDVYWAKTYHLKSIAGININVGQVEQARAYVTENGLQDRIHLQLGNAVEIPFPDNSFDKVVALECAFHFVTREKFFAEALRVLRPGGVLATADIAARKVVGPFEEFVQNQTMLVINIPEENRYTRPQYVRLLKKTGFLEAKATSIREHVFDPFYANLAESVRSAPSLRGIVKPPHVNRLLDSGESGSRYRSAYLRATLPIALVRVLLSAPWAAERVHHFLVECSPDYFIATARRSD